MNEPILDILDELPPRWDGGHVGRRLMEAMQTLRLLPMGGLGGYGGAWPSYLYEFEDLVAQEKQGELERTQKLQNRTRVMPPLRAITAMERALVWPAAFLARTPKIAQAANCVALAHALGRDAGWVAAKRGGYADTWRRNHDRGCEIIAVRLQADRIPIF